MTLTLLTGACAGTRSLTPAQVSAHETAISVAENMGALDEPQAALHLRMAREQVKRAELLMADGKDDQAELMLLRAVADAELAAAIAGQAAAQREAEIANAVDVEERS